MIQTKDPRSPIPNERIQLQDGRWLGIAEYGDPEGKPVFYFHGTPSSRLLHPDEATTTSLGARLIILERPGFGLSSFQPRRTLLDWPADVVEVADQLGIERFAVVGASGGGPYVAACAYRIPQRLTAAAIVGGIGPTDVPELAESMPAVRRKGAFIGRHIPGLLRPIIWLTQNPQRNPQRFFERYTTHNPSADRVLLDQRAFQNMLKASYAEATRAGIRGFAWEVRIASRPWGFRLQDIPIEVQLWHGEEDTSTPLIMAQHMADAIPNCRTRFLPGEGHFLLFTRWREILSALVRESDTPVGKL
jgi:pimeloyl-ACP methyl ester carboxylesterase